MAAESGKTALDYAKRARFAECESELRVATASVLKSSKQKSEEADEALDRR